MAAFIKTKLKAAKDAIGKKDYAAARSAAEGVLSFEADNYHACVLCCLSRLWRALTGRCSYRNVFLGLALSELGENEQSEQVICTGMRAHGALQLIVLAGVPQSYSKQSWSAACLAGVLPCL